MDEEEFYGTFYCASVTRCYPGKDASGRGDRTPAPHEQELCAFWREWEFELIRPRLIVTVGGLALRRLLGKSGLAECVGCRFEHGEATVIPRLHVGWTGEAYRELVAKRIRRQNDESSSSVFPYDVFQLYMADKPRDMYDVERAVADHLVGDRDVAAPRVPRLRHLQRHRASTRPGRPSARPYRALRTRFRSPQRGP